MRKFGQEGSEASEFAVPTSVAVDQQSHEVYVADGNLGSPGKLFKFDSNGQPVNWGGTEPYISGNEISGLEFPTEGEAQVAVDSTTHVVYVTSGNAIRAFLANGEPSEFSAIPGSSAIVGFSELTGLAVDVNGDIYASNRKIEEPEPGVTVDNSVVEIFALSGELITEFSVENPANLAADSTGAVYVTHLNGAVEKFTPSSPSPVTSTTTYTAALAPVDSSIDRSVGVDLATDDVYVTHSAAASSTPGVAVYSRTGTLITEFGQPSTEGELSGPTGIAIDGASTRVYVDNDATGNSRVYVFQPEPPAAPAIELLAAAGVSSTSATLRARINPNQKETTYRFEYGLEDCSVSVCTAVPAGGASIGAGNDGVPVAQEIHGLNAGTQYHFRVVAENEINENNPVEESGVFTTQVSNLGFSLPDHRAWEMVSPPNKHGALVFGGGENIIQASASGEGLAYQSSNSVESNPEGSRVPELSMILARRSSSGSWQSKDITPPNTGVAPAPADRGSEYKLFDASLEHALLEPRSDTPLSTEASERTPYLRENTEPPRYTPLVTSNNVPAGTEFGGGKSFVPGVNVLAASPDFEVFGLVSEVGLVEGAPSSSPGNQVPTVYEWNRGQIVPVSVLPGENGEIVSTPYIGSGQVKNGGSVRGAISDDGTRVFWSAADLAALYMRDTEAEETVRVDVAKGGSGAGVEKPFFQGASADGSVVFFSDSQQLTPDASAEGSDLYRCTLPRPGVPSGCATLTDLSTSVNAGESSEVQEIAAALTEDGSKIYFVAKGVLDSAPNRFGDMAVSDQPNLYVWQQGAGVRFIATLSNEDRTDWGTEPHLEETGEVGLLSAAASPSGRYFTFMSRRSLTGYETRDPVSGKPAQEIFRYDATSDRLDCISCNPTGGLPFAPTRENATGVDRTNAWEGQPVAGALPWANTVGQKGPSLYRPRTVFDNGRVFFNAIDPLVPADSNGQWDVYEYEPIGIGDCSSSSGGASISLSAGGCVALISSGTAEEEATFIDASESGDDTFFFTSAQLNETDQDHEVDIYDARVDGIPATLPSRNECLGEACRPATQPPNENSIPGSASFNGSGNLKAGKKCPKGKRKIKKGGKQRCVPKKHKRHHRHHRKGRAQR